MTVSFGFYNSVSGDRKYDAIQMSSIFDGVISDGVFMQIGDKMIVRPATGMNVIVGKGRAWFNHTWTLNDADLVLAVDPADVVLPRIDSIVLEINSSDGVRANSIKVVKGTPATNPVAPALVKTSTVNQYPLVYISVPVGLTTITASQLTNKVGTSDTPYVTGIIETVNVDALVIQWQAQFDDWAAGEQADFDTWFENVKGQLSTDPAGNLQNEIDALIAGNNALQLNIDGIDIRTDLIEAILAARVQPNLLTNGDFSVCQHNWLGSQNVGTGVHIPADRWKSYRPSFAAFTDWWYASGEERYIQMRRDQNDANVGPLTLVQEFESSDTAQLRGKKLTFSVRGQKYSAPAATISLTVYYGTGSDQSIATGYTGLTLLGTVQSDFSTADAVYKLTTPVVPSAATEIAVMIQITPTGVAPAGELFVIKSAKLEFGEYFTGWSFPNKQETLAKCQRYQFVIRGIASSMPYMPYVHTTTAVLMAVYFPQNMRVAPTITSGITGLIAGSPTGVDASVSMYDGAAPAWLTTTGTFSLDTVNSSKTVNGALLTFMSTGANYNLAPQRHLAFLMGGLAQIIFRAEL